MTGDNEMSTLMWTLTDDTYSQSERIDAFSRLVEQGEQLRALLGLWCYDCNNMSLWDVKDLIVESARLAGLGSQSTRAVLINSLIQTPEYLVPVVTMLGRAGQRFDEITPWLISILVDLLKSMSDVGYVDDAYRAGLNAVEHAMTTVAVTQSALLLQALSYFDEMARDIHFPPEVRCAAAFALGAVSGSTPSASSSQPGKTIHDFVMLLGIERGASGSIHRQILIEEDLLANALKSAQSAERLSATFLLAESTTQTVAARYLRDDDPYVRDAAIFSLGWPALITLDKNEKSTVLSVLRELLVEKAFIPLGVPRMIGMICEHNGDIAPIADLADGALHHEDVDLRREMAWALKHIGGDEAINILESILDDEDMACRCHAALRLVEVGNMGAEDILLDSLQHQWPQMVGPGRWAAMTQRVWPGETIAQIEKYGSPDAQNTTREWRRAAVARAWSRQ